MPENRAMMGKGHICLGIISEAILTSKTKSKTSVVGDLHVFACLIDLELFAMAESGILLQLLELFPCLLLAASV